MSKRSSILLALLTLAAGNGRSAHAQTAPVELVVSSPRSTAGSFGLTISGATPDMCAALIAKTTLDDGGSLRFRAVRDCQYEAVPEASLAAGRHCIDARDYTGSRTKLCFEITGVVAEPSSAKLVLTSQPPDSWLPANCDSCPNTTTGMPCTRQRRQRVARLTLEGVAPELSSRYTFAAVDVSAADSPQPADYFLLDGALAKSLSVMQRTTDQQACLDVYARAFSASEATKLGQVCVPAVLPDTVPATFRAGSACDAAYRTKWCNDSRPDCATDAGLDACSQYKVVCEGAADAGATSDAAVVGLDASTPGPSGSVDSSTDKRSSTGCSAGASGSTCWPLAALVAAALRRRRRSRARLTLR